MSAYVGQVQNGVVVLDGGVTLPDGLKVRVEPLEPASPPGPPLPEQLLQWAGKGVELPADLARRHDHYLHGTD